MVEGPLVVNAARRAYRIPFGAAHCGDGVGPVCLRMPTHRDLGGES
jgi:hypothetical protein